MLKKLRTIFQAQAKEEPGLTTLSSENLPLWLAEERDKARCELEAAASEFRPRVLAAVQAARQGLGVFSDIPDTGGVHPKLGRVLKNAGPEFARAMESVLSRELPSKPEEAYAAAAEMLRGGLRVLSGPGKYLRSAFPDDIRAIQSAFDAIGQEVNQMNPPLAAFRERQSRINAVEKACQSHREGMALIAAIRRDIEVISLQERDLEERIRMCAEKKDAVISGAEYVSFQEFVARKTGVEEDLRHKERSVRTLIASVAHALERAGKISRKGGDDSLERGVGMLQSVMTQETLPDLTEVKALLSPLLTRAGMMASGGALPLRNREEREYIGDPAVFWRELDSAATAYSAAYEAKRRYDEEVAAHPVSLQMAALAREEEVLHQEAVRLQERRSGEEDRMRKAELSVSAAVSTLSEGLSDLSEGRVVLSQDEFSQDENS